MSVRIAPSILSADFAALGDADRRRRTRRRRSDSRRRDGRPFRAQHHHRPAGRRARSSASRRVPLDVHLMITDPDRYIEAFAEAGAAMISVHVEVLPHLHRTVHAIKALGVKAGVVLNPSTPVGALEDSRRRRRLRARDVGEPRLRRPDFHPAQRVQSPRGARAARPRGQPRADRNRRRHRPANVARVVAAGARIDRRRLGHLSLAAIPSAPPAT